MNAPVAVIAFTLFNLIMCYNFYTITNKLIELIKSQTACLNKYSLGVCKLQNRQIGRVNICFLWLKKLIGVGYKV
jgi:hypothetical protein